MVFLGSIRDAGRSVMAQGLPLATIYAPTDEGTRHRLTQEMMARRAVESLVRYSHHTHHHLLLLRLLLFLRLLLLLLGYFLAEDPGGLEVRATNLTRAARNCGCLTPWAPVGSKGLSVCPLCFSVYNYACLVVRCCGLWGGRGLPCGANSGGT